jgi:hypothetical protein
MIGEQVVQFGEDQQPAHEPAGPGQDEAPAGRLQCPTGDHQWAYRAAAEVGGLGEVEHDQRACPVECDVERIVQQAHSQQVDVPAGAEQDVVVAELGVHYDDVHREDVLRENTAEARW